MPQGNKPSAKFRIGYVSATVWKNGDYFSVNVARSYKDDEGQWQETDSLGHADVLCAIKVLSRAESFISEQS